MDRIRQHEINLENKAYAGTWTQSRAVRKTLLTRLRLRENTPHHTAVKSSLERLQRDGGRRLCFWNNESCEASLNLSLSLFTNRGYESVAQVSSGDQTSVTLQDTTTPQHGNDEKSVEPESSPKSSSKSSQHSARSVSEFLKFDC